MRGATDDEGVDVRTSTEPVMALLRVKAPADVDPHVLEAALTRAICTNAERPLSAELEWVPAWREPAASAAKRRFVFVAVLRGPAQAGAEELAAAAERAAKRALKRMFGKATAAKAKARPAEDPEVATFWCAFRGTPHKVGHA
ncbi:hypothetical protein GCM10023215_23010 [Pseudonocardia yuanmonensis]|uniref:Uncharacterized protein n=1 Tax=Pseudonocardia yuanmonensis TaxID=1095914 RepID=A0ABP8WDC9_9PSEU